MAPIPVFYSHASSEQDLDLLAEMLKHLAPLERGGLLSGWHRGMVEAGRDRDAEIHAHLEGAQIIVLLVSPDLLASDLMGTEVTRAMERREAGEARVIPILARPTNWKEEAFGALVPLPKDGVPVTSQPSRDEAWNSITSALREVLHELASAHAAPRKAPATGAVAGPAAASAAAPAAASATAPAAAPAPAPAAASATAPPDSNYSPSNPPWRIWIALGLCVALALYVYAVVKRVPQDAGPSVTELSRTLKCDDRPLTPASVQLFCRDSIRGEAIPTSDKGLVTIKSIPPECAGPDAKMMLAISAGSASTKYVDPGNQPEIDLKDTALCPREKEPVPAVTTSATTTASVTAKPRDTSVPTPAPSPALVDCTTVERTLKNMVEAGNRPRPANTRSLSR